MYCVLTWTALTIIAAIVFPTSSNDSRCKEMRKRPCSAEFNEWQSCTKQYRDLYMKWQAANPADQTPDTEKAAAKDKFDASTKCMDKFIVLKNCINQHKEEYIDIINFPGEKPKAAVSYSEEDDSDDAGATKQRRIRTDLDDEEES
jgi:hypothetical protein